MKRLFLTIAVASVMLSACKKDEAVVPTSTSTAVKAIIKGKTIAQIDETAANKGANEMAPSGTVIIAKVKHDASSEAVTYKAEVDGSGEYTFSIPTRNEGIEVIIVGSEFTANKKTDSTDDNGNAIVKETRTEYSPKYGEDGDGNSLPNYKVMIYPNSTVIQDINY